MNDSSTDHSSLKSFSRAGATSPSTLLLGRARQEELKLLYKDPKKYQNNRKGRILFWIMAVFLMVSIVLVAYNGGFSSVRNWDELEDVQNWRRIWNSSVPLWSILISNFGVLLICALIAQSRRLFIQSPKKPLVLVILAVMAASSFVLFLHPLDEVFYPGMLMVLFQNYLWLFLMVRRDDPLAAIVHPYLHDTYESKYWIPFQRPTKLNETKEKQKSNLFPV